MPSSMVAGPIGVQMTLHCNQESLHGSQARQTTDSLLIATVNRIEVRQ